MDHTAEWKTGMEQNKKLRIIIAAGLLIWILAIVLFWVFTGPGDAMGYSVLFLYGLLPLSMLVSSALIAGGGFGQGREWVVILLCGAAEMLAEYLTFSLANMILTGCINAPSLLMFALGAIVSLAGIGAGLLFRFGRKSGPR